MYDVLRLEFKDARKPVMIQMTNLSVAVEDMYKFILERIEDIEGNIIFITALSGDFQLSASPVT